MSGASEKFILKLYITGDSQPSQSALSTLRHACDNQLKDRVELTVIDVAASPDRAEADRIIATPTLVREKPLPARRIIGDIASLEILSRELGLTHPWQDKQQ